MRRVLFGLVMFGIAAGVVSYRDVLLDQLRQLHPQLAAVLMPYQPGSFAAMVKRVSPSVVTVLVTDARTSGIGNGSGFIIDADGHIVTNDHVVDGASKIEVLFDDGTRAPAVVIGRDQPTDLALIKVSVSRPLPFVRFGDDRLAEVGDWVLAIGSPDMKPGTVTAGIISAKGRDGVKGGSQFTSYLQIDAALNSGNSGGPTFNLSGEVVGVNVLSSYKASDQRTGVGERYDGVAFAIPASTASVVVQGLRSGRFNRGLLGVVLASLSDEDAVALGLANRRGALVTRVVPRSPAAEAGLRANDVVLRVDGQPVSSELDALRKISLLQPGQTAVFTIWRDKGEMEFSIKVASRDVLRGAARAPVTGPAPAPISFASLGVTLQGVPVAGVPSRSGDGVFVEGIIDAGRPSGIGLQRGDRITAVGAVPVVSLEDVASALAEAEARNSKGVIVYVEAPMGGRRHVAVRLQPAD